MSRKDARTANPDKSIWTSLPESVFRQHLVKLEERTNAVPISPQIFNVAEWTDTSRQHNLSNDHTLPLAIEQQLADDFACLVAVEEGAQSVAAVCVEERLLAPKLTLRFAALDASMNDAVWNALQQTSNMLSRATRGAEPSPTNPLCDHVDELFHVIIRLHFRRLLARLRSSKWEKPKYLSRSHKKPLWQDIANVIHRAQHLYTKKEKGLRVLVEKLLLELAAVYEGFEAVSSDDLTAMEKLVKASFDFSSTPAMKDFLVRLESSIGATPTSQVAAAMKSLRQIQKIGSYRRICVFLVNTAKEYPKLFENGITFEYMIPYQGVPTTIGYEEWATTCHVHAEVQLAVHYDMLSQQEQETFIAPRAIGISKFLCYLCYRFLLAHDRFFPSRTHGRLYDQWTLPDLAEFDSPLVERYRGILKAVDEEVVRHTENEPELWRLEPMTSIDIYCA